jgi:hypothetical protein
VAVALLLQQQDFQAVEAVTVFQVLGVHWHKLQVQEPQLGVTVAQA